MSAKLNTIAIQLCVPISQAECFVNQVNQNLPRKMTYKAISRVIRSLPLPDRSPMSVAAQLVKEYHLLSDNPPIKDETPAAQTQAAPMPVTAQLLEKHQLLPDSLPTKDETPVALVQAAQQAVVTLLVKKHQFLPDNPPTKDETPVTQTQAAPLAQEYTLRVVGVTFDGRQAVVAKLTPSEPVVLKREPTNPYDRNAIMVVRLTGEQIGYIDRFTAARIAPRLDRLGGSVNGAVTRISGMSYPRGSLGVQIHFGLPIEAEEI